MPFSTVNLPKISVVTPSFNSGRFIEQTIQSVITQEYPYLEYIVIDGGSSDETLDIIKKYDRSLTWISEKDRGQSNAINKGLRMATGEVLAYLNADDIYEPGALLRVGEFIHVHPKAYWLTGRCRFIDANGKEIRRLAKWYKNFWLLWRSYTALLVLDYVSQPATFWQQKVFNKVGFFNEDLHYAMDYDFSLRVGKYFKMWHINHTLAAYRVHGESKTFSSKSSIDAQFNEDLVIAKENGATNLLSNLHMIHNEMIKRIYYGLLQIAV